METVAAKTASRTKKRASDVQTIQGTKYLWQLKKSDADAIRQISMTHNISSAVAHVLYSRGYHDDDAIRSFLFSSYERDVPHSGLLKGAHAATKRLLEAIERKEKILIFGDYDVDGVTSSSLVLLGLLPLGAQINFFLPNRKRDGYGLSSKIVKRAKENGYSLIITVDNGITAIQPALDAQEVGIDLIITDHHRPHDHVPEALAIVNPNQVDCPYPYKSLAGVGVAFKIISLIYEQKNLPLPDKVYELLMLGTVADVVPMLGENRYWVRYGLSKVNKQRSTAMNVMTTNSKLTKNILGSLDIGFMVAPQINALGRLDDCREAVKFLISSDYAEVQRIGHILQSMNEERKKVEQRIYGDVEGAIVQKQINLARENIIVAAHDQWPAGVIGLVAGKLMHNYGKPTFLFHHDKQNRLLKGSCRSIPEFDVFDALHDSKDLLVSFGGHSCAAGLALAQDNLPELKARLEERVTAMVSPKDLQPKIVIDAQLELTEATKKLVDDLSMLEPFGNANPQPVFLIKQATLLKEPTLLKDKHLKCSIFSEGMIKPIIFFNRPDLYSLLLELGDKPFSVAAYVVTNEWQGKTSIELQGLDISVT